MKTKFALLIVVTALSLPFSQTQALAEAPTGLSITSGSVVAGVLSFDSEVPNCASLTPQYKYFSSDDAVNVLTRMAMVNEKDKRSINILVIMATAEMIPNCTIDSLKTEHFSVTLPPGIKYRSIFDMVSRKYVTGGINNPASPSTPDPSSSTTTSGEEFPRNVVDLLEVRQVTDTGTVYNDF